MDPDQQRLADDLNELADLLSSQGEHHWADWKAGARQQLLDGDPHGADRVIRAYGGMGSFTDIWIDDPRAQELRSNVYRQAAQIRANREAHGR